VIYKGGFELKKILIAVALCLVMVGLIASPVLAATTVSYKVNGLEINAGSFDGTNTNGAHFVALATKTSLPILPLTTGVLNVLVNYQGDGPNSTGDKTNSIVGGTWTLTVTSRTAKGTITGNIISGIIQWKLYKGNPTGWGDTTINLLITGGTGDFTNITGSGTFTGYDNHMSGIYVLGIQVPVTGGQLNLSY
jgi:hypothetical protein